MNAGVVLGKLGPEEAAEQIFRAYKDESAWLDAFTESLGRQHVAAMTPVQGRPASTRGPGHRSHRGLSARVHDAPTRLKKDRRP